MLRVADSVIGNTRVLESLDRVAGSPHLGHAYLFHGPEGVGKRLAALAFAGRINCQCRDGGASGKPSAGKVAPGGTGPGEASGLASGGTSAGETIGHPPGDIEVCESCRLTASLSHPELLLLEDINRPRWLARRDVLKAVGLIGGKSEEGESREGAEGAGNAGPGRRAEYAALIEGLHEKGYLEEPLPDAGHDTRVDGFNIVTDRLFGKGSVPSKECYTPKAVSDEIRKAYDQGNLSDEEYGLLKMLYEYPMSLMPYRGAIPIAYITVRKGWKFTRPVQPFLSVKTMLGGKKIVVIDDAHKMTAEAQNCLLKTLEEPPADSVLILVTPDKRALFETVVSRCQVVNFGRLTREEMDRAAADLTGGSPDSTGPVATLSENCPGRLLELGLEDVAGKLKSTCEYFSGITDGGLAPAFRLSGLVMEAAGSHRRKQRRTVTESLELVGLWMAQVLRVQAGLADTLEESVLSKALKQHARHFDRSALLRASEDLEQAFGLVRWNIDMKLLLDNTLLRIARRLGS